MKNQIQRIEEMEQRMQRLAVAVKKLRMAMEAYVQCAEDRKLLDGYYGSADWWKDVACDEAGALPDDLLRGVLSQDGLWNLLEECRAIDKLLPNSSISDGEC